MNLRRMFTHRRDGTVNQVKFYTFLVMGALVLGYLIAKGLY